MSCRPCGPEQREDSVQRPPGERWDIRRSGVSACSSVVPAIHSFDPN